MRQGKKKRTGKAHKRCAHPLSLEERITIEIQWEAGALHHGDQQEAEERQRHDQPRDRRESTPTRAAPLGAPPCARRPAWSPTALKRSREWPRVHGMRLEELEQECDDKVGRNAATITAPAIIAIIRTERHFVSTEESIRFSGRVRARWRKAERRRRVTCSCWGRAVTGVLVKQARFEEAAQWWMAADGALRSQRRALVPA